MTASRRAEVAAAVAAVTAYIEPAAVQEIAARLVGLEDAAVVELGDALAAEMIRLDPSANGAARAAVLYVAFGLARDLVATMPPAGRA